MTIRVSSLLSEDDELPLAEVQYTPSDDTRCHALAYCADLYPGSTASKWKGL